jgi:2-haloalkanoic acid dehalogenase type II
VIDRIRLVSFDLYGTLLDLDGLIEPLSAYTKMAVTVRDSWRQRQLQLANASASSGRYMDFDRITLSALHEISERYYLRLSGTDQKHLLDRWAHLPPYEDAIAALRAAANCGVTLAVMTNAVGSTAKNALTFAGLSDYFKYVFSSDSVKTFKPKAELYAQSVGAGFEPYSTLFVSANDWDATGARQSGFHTVFVNRRKATLSIKPERTIDDLTQLEGVLAGFGLAPA